jgi:TolA-binding protein
VLAAAGTKPSKPTPTTAKAAVEAGLQVFQESKDYAEAVRLFKAALELQPNSEEAAAALFNLGCAYAKQRNFKAASEAIGTAINEHNLKLKVALQVSRGS